MRCRWCWIVLLLVGCQESSVPVDLGVSPGEAFYSPQAIVAADGLVLVANTGFHFKGAKEAWAAGSVTVIERTSRKVVAQIPTSSLNPQALAVHGDRAYVVNSGTVRIDDEGVARPQTDGSIDILDLTTSPPRRVATIPLGRTNADSRIGAYASIALSEDGKLALLGSGTRGDVFKVDLQAKQVLRGADDPIALFPTAAGENGLTTVRALEGGEVAVLNYNSDELCLSSDWAGDLAKRRCGPVGMQSTLLEGPIDIVPGPGKHVLVLMTIANSLYRVDPNQSPFSIEANFAKTGLANNRVKVHGDQAFIVNTLSNNLQRVALGTGDSKLPLAVLPVGSKPYDMVITEETQGTLAWVTLNGSHTVAVVDLVNGEVVELIQNKPSAGDAGPDGAVEDGGIADGPFDAGLLDATPDAVVDQSPPDQAACPEAGLPPVVGIHNVVQVTYGAGAGLGQSKMPGVIQGGPVGGGSGSGSTSGVLSLGVGGQMVVDFGPYDIVDGPGPDLVVFENPFVYAPYTSNAEPARVAASISGTKPVDFVEFSCDLSATTGDPQKKLWPYPGCAGVQPVLANPAQCIAADDPVVAGGDAFDLADLKLTQVRYLRITDAGVSKMGTDSKGFDLDAVVLINYKKR